MDTAIEVSDMSDDTSIRVSEELANELYQRKGRSKSYEDYIWELLAQVDDTGGPVTDSAEKEPDPSASTPGFERDKPPSTTPEPADSVSIGDDGGGVLRDGVAARDLLDEIAEDTLPGSGAKLDERRDALLAAVEYLVEHGRATPSDFQAEVYPEHSARYTDGEDPARSWWKNCVYKGLRELAERSDVIGKPDQTGEWTYTGETS